jgi:hypothetical protein
MTRPTFDPTVYADADLAEINRPMHQLGWDLIEAERALDALKAAPKAQWDAAFETYAAARKAHDAGLLAYDAAIAAYCEAAEEREAAAERAEADAQRAAEPTFL